MDLGHGTDKGPVGICGSAHDSAKKLGVDWRFFKDDKDCKDVGPFWEAF